MGQESKYDLAEWVPYFRILPKAETEVLAGAVFSFEGLIRGEPTSKMTHRMCLGGLATKGMHIDINCSGFSEKGQYLLVRNSLTSH